MKRQEWLFQFRASDLAGAARRLLDYHSEQLRRYELHEEIAFGNAKDAAVEVQEFAMTGGTRKQIVIDPTVQTRLRLLEQKINDHTVHTAAMRPWVACFELMPGDQMYELDPDDVLFFDVTGYRNKEELEYVSDPVEGEDHVLDLS